jgi:two-component system, cell cycle response regulator
MIKKTEVIGRQPERVAWLYVISGSDVGRDFRLGADTLLGRDTSCDVILFDDHRVSKEHARIVREGQEFVLYDLASLNGTLINGTRVQRRFLDDNDEIAIGTTRLLFKVTPKRLLG